MKRHIAAVAFAVLAAPALAQNGAPYDQSVIDRQLPNIEFAPVQARVADERAPYDQLAVDRALPTLPAQTRQIAEVSSGGNTRSDVEISTDEASSVSNRGLASGPWANDYHFIAPAQ